MAEHDEALVERAAEAILFDAQCPLSGTTRKHIARAVLDAVAPAIEARALRSAADLVSTERANHVIASTRAPAAGALFRAEQSLRDRADRIEGEIG
jgi:hypothetical protein